MCLPAWSDDAVTAATEDILFSLSDPLPTSGTHAGFVKIPYASNQSSYGFLPVPLAVVGGSVGPTVLLLAGVAGDEMEAQIAAARIVRSLDPEAMKGRVIAMTMANVLAGHAGTRNSPVDGQSLNKSFPGDLFGSPTSAIAEYIERHLMPECDLVIDLHSTGRTMRYLSCATLIDDADPDVQRRRLALARAFNASNIVRFRSFDYRSTSGAARRSGATRIGVQAPLDDAMDEILRGFDSVLAWAGIVEKSQAAVAPRLLLAHRDHDFVHAMSDGIFEPIARLGDEAKAGDLAGYIHDLTRPMAEPVALRLAADGVVLGTREAGWVRRGDCVLLLAEDGDLAAREELDEAADLRWLTAPNRRTAKPRRKVTSRKYGGGK